jgi:hypothetical protein
MGHNAAIQQGSTPCLGPAFSLKVNIMRALTTQENASLLAALRYWQSQITDAARGIPARAVDRYIPIDLRDHFLECAPLTSDEIEELCEDINMSFDEEPIEWGYTREDVNMQAANIEGDPDFEGPKFTDEEKDKVWQQFKDDGHEDEIGSLNGWIREILEGLRS